MAKPDKVKESVEVPTFVSKEELKQKVEEKKKKDEEEQQ